MSSDHLATLLNTYENRPHLWIGSGMSLAKGYPSWDGLAKSVLKLLDRPTQKDLQKANSVEIFSTFEAKYGRNALISKVYQEMDSGEPTFNPIISELLEHFDTDYIFTTNYDQIIEATVSNTQVLKRNADVALQRPNKKKVVKVHGCLSDPETLVLSEADYLKVMDPGRPIGMLVENVLTSRSIVFIGYSVTDANLLQSLHRVRDRMNGFQRQHVAITINKNPSEVAKLARHGVFVDNLTLHGRANRGKHLVQHVRNAAANRTMI